MKDITKIYNLADEQVQGCLSLFKEGDLLCLTEQEKILGHPRGIMPPKSAILMKGDVVIYLGYRVCKFPTEKRQERIYAYFLYNEKVVITDFWSTNYQNFRVIGSLNEH